MTASSMAVHERVCEFRVQACDFVALGCPETAL
jgi:hypothetical protein